MPAAGWTKLTEEEIRLARKWYSDEQLSPSTIAQRLGRDRSVMTRLLVKKVTRKRQGRPRVLTEAQVDFLERRLDELVREANCKYTVTVLMLKKSARVKASVRAIRNALHKRST